MLESDDVIVGVDDCSVGDIDGLKFISKKGQGASYGDDGIDGKDYGVDSTVGVIVVINNVKNTYFFISSSMI